MVARKYRLFLIPLILSLITLIVNVVISFDSKISISTSLGEFIGLFNFVSLSAIALSVVFILHKREDEK